LNTKTAGILVILIIIGAVGAGVFLLLGTGPEPGTTLEDTPSSTNGDAWISEVHMNTTLTVDEEYFELYVSETFSSNSMSGFIVTTFDDEGQIELPTVTDVDEEDYIAVYTGVGEDDLDASDGSASIHLDLASRILDPSGDEIGVFDSSGNVIHFIRYEGGNGDPVYDSWPTGDDGPSLPSGHTGSISLFDISKADTSSWMESELTPGAPNAHAFYTDTDPSYHVTIKSGVHQQYSFTGIDDTKEAGKNETIDVFPAAGVNASQVNSIKEYIQFSLEFYHGKGFTRGPATYKPGRINVTVVQGTRTETVGSCNTDGEIVIKIGTINSSIDLKYVCEHELMHAFQFKSERVDGKWRDHAPVKNKWWIEGQATYWGIESTKANYNLTNKEIQDEFKRVGDHNWYTHYTDLNRSVFLGWGKSYSDYMGSYLFMKFIKEKFGEDKLKDIFDRAVDVFEKNATDTSPEDAAADVLGIPWDTLVAMFHAWMMSGAISDNGVPERKTHVNVTYNGATTGDSIGVAPYGAGVERIKVNDSTPFNMDFQTEPGSVWKITIIYVYEDGSREQGFNCPRTYAGTSAPWPVNPGSHGKKLVEIIVIKTLVQTNETSTINMTVTPIEHVSPTTLLPNQTGIFEFPPGFYNYTDPSDWPWNQTWWFNYTDTPGERSVIINTTEFFPDSFFDIFFELDRVLIDYQLNVPVGPSPNVIPWSPDDSWPFGVYNITMVQSTPDSFLRGTIMVEHINPVGGDIRNPIWVDVGGYTPLDIPVPYATTEIFINFTAVVGFWYYVNLLSDIGDLTVDFWNGSMWLAIPFNGVDAYWVTHRTWTDVVCVRVVPGGGSGIISGIEVTPDN
jgi:hypothetical protein